MEIESSRRSPQLPGLAELASGASPLLAPASWESGCEAVIASADELCPELMRALGGTPSPLSREPAGGGEARPALASWLASSSSSERGSSRASSAQSVLRALLPAEMLGSLVLDALNGFMFLVSADAQLNYVSENVDDFLGAGALADMVHRPVFDYLHADDHENLRALLRSSPASSLGAGGLASNQPRSWFIRFRRAPGSVRDGPDSPQSSGPTLNRTFECLQVSALAVSPQDRVIHHGRDLSAAKLICVARKVGQSERKQFMKVEMFSTKVDPDQNYLVHLVDTTGMNSRHTVALTKHMLNRRLLHDLCHPEDRVMLEKHLQESMEKACVSSVYRLKILENIYMRVKTKSKFYAACPQANNFQSFIISSHSIITESESMDKDVSAALQTNLCNQGSASAPGSPEQALRSRVLEELFGPTSFSGMGDFPLESRPEDGFVSNNNVVKPNTSRSGSSSASGGGPEPEETCTKQKNLLLKQLLNVNFNREERGAKSSCSMLLSDAPHIQVPVSSPSSNSRILKLLSHSNDNVPTSSNFGANLSPAATCLPSQNSGSNVMAGVKRPAVSSSSSPMLESALGAPSPKMSASSMATSSVCKENPALAKLLEKPPHNSTVVPPPVPTKWHQEPREKLPKSAEGLKKYLPPHPAERASTSHTTSTATLASSSHSTTTSLSGISMYKTTSSTVLQPRDCDSKFHGFHDPSTSEGLPSVSISIGNAVTTIQSSTSAHFLSDPDPELSNILDEVIDIQENHNTPVTVTGSSDMTPTSSHNCIMSSVASCGPALTSREQPFFNSKAHHTDRHAMAHIENIEKYLASSDHNPVFPSPPGSNQSQHHHQEVLESGHKLFQRSISLPPVTNKHGGLSSAAMPVGSCPPGVIQTMAGTGRSAPDSHSVASNGNRQFNQSNNNNSSTRTHVLSGSRANPVSLVPRMSELFQGVPPNMTLPETPDIDSLVMIQQRQRRMSSGGTPQARRGPQHRSPSGGSNLTMQSLVSPPNRSISLQASLNNLPLGNGPVLGGNNHLLMQQLKMGRQNAKANHQPMGHMNYYGPRVNSYLGHDEQQLSRGPNVGDASSSRVSSHSSHPSRYSNVGLQPVRQHPMYAPGTPMTGISMTNDGSNMDTSTSTSRSGIHFHPQSSPSSSTASDDGQSLLQKLLSEGSH